MKNSPKFKFIYKWRLAQLSLALLVGLFLTACGSEVTPALPPPTNLPTQPAPTPTITPLAFTPTAAVAISSIPTVTPQPPTATPTLVAPTIPPTTIPPTAAPTTVAPTPTVASRTLSLKQLSFIPAVAGGTVKTLAFSPDSKSYLATGGRDSLKLREIATGKELVTFQHLFTEITTLDFSPDGKTVVVGGLGGASVTNRSETVKAWNVADGKPLAAFETTYNRVLSVAFSDDGKTLAVIGEVGDNRRLQLDLWDFATRQRGSQVDLGDCSVAVLSPDSKSLALGCAGGNVKISNLLGGKEIYFNSVGGEVPFQLNYRMAFNTDGKILATSIGSDDNRDGTLKTWEVATGKELVGFKGHKLPVSALTFSSSAKTLASASFDGTLKLWDVADRRELFSLSLVQAPATTLRTLTFSPNGAYLAATQEDGSVRLWQLVG